MDKISRVLVPFDFSEAAKTGLDYAVNFVEKHDDMEIVLCYIAEDPDHHILAAEFETTQINYHNKLKLPMTWVLGQDGLTSSILGIQKEKDIDLIIMGTSGIKSLDIANTHTSELVLEADCPVIVVPQDATTFNLKQIGLVLGPNEIDDPKVLVALLDISRKFNAKVHIITIEKEPNSYGYTAADEKNENILQYYLEGFYQDHTLIVNPDVREGILNFVSEKDLDMIAILPRNHTKKSAPSKGLLTKELTLHSTVPILAID
ncbi:universal stress protein [Spongiimicrobium sp. 3-5]|uniref:universal stress protein n=1 Tax=Spongiimicrobium sp. 3-5 TaxID=3332596 RepID=UPI00397FF2C4